MLTACGSEPAFCDCAVVTSVVLSVSNVCSFNITKVMKYGVFVGNTGHFDNEINLAGSGGLGHECRRLQASIDRFVFPSATVWSLLEAYKNEVYLLPKELDEKIASTTSLLRLFRLLRYSL